MLGYFDHRNRSYEFGCAAIFRLEEDIYSRNVSCNAIKRILIKEQVI